MLQLIHTCDVARKEAVGTNGRQAVATVHTGVPCLVLPVDARTAVANNFELGKAYDFYFDSSADVKTGDKLTYNGQTYTVSGKQLYLVPMVNHLHVTAEQEVA